MTILLRVINKAEVVNFFLRSTWSLSVIDVNTSVYFVIKKRHEMTIMGDNGGRDRQEILSTYEKRRLGKSNIAYII